MPVEVNNGSGADAAQAANVRERIVAAARAEFAKLGLRATSVRVLAAKADVTAAMINYYFGSKRALYDQIVEEAQADLRARVARALAGATPAELASRLAAAYFDFLAEEHDLQRLILREVLDSGEGLGGYVERYVAPMRALFAARFGDDDATAQAAISLFGAIAGYFLYSPVLGELFGDDPMSPERLANRRRHVMALADLLVEDIGATPSNEKRKKR